jgi:zinc transporter 9
MSLSQSQLRLISTIGMGVLVGTSLIVIIPEGIEAIYTAGDAGHTHVKRGLSHQQIGMNIRWAPEPAVLINGEEHTFQLRDKFSRDLDAVNALPGPVIPADDLKDTPVTVKESGAAEGLQQNPPTPPPVKEHGKEPPTFYIGLSLITGFILMFLIDKLPRHAAENLQPAPPARHISLDNLSQGLHRSSSVSSTEETEGFLQSLTPTPKQTRSLATTTGLVIHAAADGIAMGASASTANTKLGFIIFIAIMVHKAPAAFGLTSVLLKQGLSKRAARGHLIIFSLAAPVGAISTFLLVHLIGGVDGIDGENGQWWTGMLLLFSAGTFL